MIHPATAHFAIVLPIVALVFGLIYMFTKSEGMSKISSRLFVAAALAMIGVWYTGSQAGPEVYDYLSEAGQATLRDHKELGELLAIAMGIIALIKFAGCQMKKFAIEALAVLLLLGATGATLYQGKLGGEVTYNFGMPFKAYMMEDSLNEAVKAAEEEDSDEAKVTVYEDAIDEIKAFSEEQNALYGEK
ncbi:MAG: hypothetical protein JXQ67_00915 [Campylobacterales bacterium]|nr:hypothetical protein [Campylobacterales bacterium]